MNKCMTGLRKPRRLGRTGFEVFPLGLGGHVYPVGEGEDCFRTPDERAQLVSFLYRNGVNYFDTTWINELELLADSLRRAAIPADRVHVSMQYVDGISDPRLHDSLRKEIEDRLELLGLSCAPLFLLGVGNADVGYGQMAGAMEALERMRGEGLVRNIGISCHSLPHFPLVERLIRETDVPDYMMIRFNPKYPDANSGLFQAAADKDVGIVLMKLFCWDCGPGQWGRRISVFEGEKEPESPGMTAAMRNLAWCLGTAPCATSAVSMNTLKEAQDNLAALDLDPDSGPGGEGEAQGAALVHGEPVGEGPLGSAETGEGSGPGDAGSMQALIPEFDRYSRRLWTHDGLADIISRTESETIRQRARVLLDGLDQPGGDARS